MRLQFTLPFCGRLTQRWKALITHELLHVLGLIHTQNRADRDKYIKIVNKNVRKGKQKNFHTKGDDTTTRNFDYDYDSIMHYGPYYFR